MLKIFRRGGPKSKEREIPIGFALAPIIGGGLMTIWGVWMLISGQPVADTFWSGLIISIWMMIIGIGILAYLWRLDRKNDDGGEAR